MLFFTILMKKIYYYIAVFSSVLMLLSCSNTTQTTNPDEVKVVLRSIGHKLLLSQQDSTSLVLPIEIVDKNTYRLKFQNALSIEPDTLVNTVKQVFKNSKFPTNYIIEVEQCRSEEIAYSYQIKSKKEMDIVPCKGRVLPKSCYVLLVKFQNKESNTDKFVWLIPIILLGLIGYVLLRRKRIPSSHSEYGNKVKLGSFTFYPKQHKLVKQATEINLSKKECEILEIFTKKPNEIISRDELTKRIWEDNGVIVGRSLDTYISKLRKKLQEDPNIKLINVHGIGYKLEI